VVQTVRDAVGEWVRHWYQERKNLEVAVPLGGGALEPVELHRVEVSSATATSGESVWSLIWSYPADLDDKLLWQSSITVAEAEGVSEVGVVIRIASREFRIAPPSFDVRRPYIVKALLEALPCYLGGKQLRASPQSVGVEDVAAFETFLFGRDRRLPIVLFSRDPYTDQCLASPGRAADVLAGLAYVYVLNDKWAGFRLTSAIGRTFSCFNGAVRIYWPGLAEDASPLRHKLFMPDEVRELNQDFADHLMRRFAPISALRLTELASGRKARAALEADRSREASQLAEQLKAGTVAREQVESEFLKLVEERDAALSARKAAEAERDDAQFRVLELEDENAQLKENLKAISAYQHPERQVVAPPQPEQPEPETVRAALDLAGRTFSDRLIIWSSAERSADKSAFARPSEVYEALMALRELADAHFKAKKDGRPIGAWEDWFEKKGFKYAAKESQNTLNMYGSDRDFTHKGERRRMVRHLTLGGGDRNNCLQIYFEIDEATERFLVGYCGVHLPYYGMRT
jgi:hypothetical protein